jgi:hypothetical protein
VVGRGDDLPQVRAGDGAAERDVHVRGEPSLGFDCGEVLDVVAEVAAQVLDEPVEQRGEVDRVAGGAPVPEISRLTGKQSNAQAVILAPDCPARGHRVKGGPFGPSHAIGYAGP